MHMRALQTFKLRGDGIELRKGQVFQIHNEKNARELMRDGLADRVAPELGNPALGQKPRNS